MNIQSEKKFVSDLVSYIIARTAGTHNLDAFVSERPSKKFIIGTLAAKRKSEPRFNYADLNKASIRAQSLRVSFLVEKGSINDDSSLDIYITGNVYYKRYTKDLITKINNNESNLPSKRNLSRKTIWKRLNYSDRFISSLTIASSKQIDFSVVRKKANIDPNISDKITNNIWSAEVSIKKDDFDEKNIMISIFYTNTGIEPNRADSYERTLFDCKLEVVINNMKITKFVDEYLYEGYKQRYYYDFRTMNCQAYWLEEGKKFYTEHYGYFEQENIHPREKINGINISFEELKKEYGLLNLDKIVELMKYLLDEYVTNLDYHNYDDEKFMRKKGKIQQTYGEKRRLVENFKILLQKVESGVELIKKDQHVKHAFLMTNETFHNYYSVKGLTNAGWRVFQLVFLLAVLESVIKGHERDCVDVLHVDTGGGKSEAYFGLIVFTAFYERIIGKKSGVTAIVKFPLRMLSIQQLERLSSIIIHAEEVRKKNKNCIGEEFSLGYYVGNRDEFPDTYAKNKKYLLKRGQDNNPPISPILHKCPLCGRNENTIRIFDEPSKARIIHKCEVCEKEFHIYTSDREIFRWRPTVVVSTVDKWANLSQQRRARNLLGGKGSLCPKGHGYIPSGDICEDNRYEAFRCEEIGGISSDTSKGPVLSIQDEMHLLREGFGTISAHFEGFIETFIEKTSGHKLKHITMSATLNGTKNQIYELYKKNAFIIPGKCPEGVGSRKDLFFQKLDGPKRIIYGLKPNLRDNHYACLRSLLHFAEFILEAKKQLQFNARSFCLKYGLNNAEEAEKLIKQYLIPLTYHIKKQDAYDMERLKGAVVDDQLRKNYDAKMRGTVITGDTSLEDLKRVIDNVKRFVEQFSINTEEESNFTFEPIYATSVVSHGIDLDELNFMLFQGLPYSTSEYIQALSRVGRKHLGVVLLWFYPNRVRDDSFFRNFNRYHETLDHQVRPIPINRYSKLGLLQTINSLFCGGIINFLSNEKDKPLYRKKDVCNLTLVEQEKLVDLIIASYGRKALDINVAKEVEDRITQIKLSNSRNNDFFPKILKRSGNYYYRNQSGMRGIQQQLVLELKESDQHYLDERRN